MAMRVIMKNELNTVCKITIALQIINVILHIVAIILVLYFVIGSACSYLKYSETDIYQDYTCVSPHLKWDESQAKDTHSYMKVLGTDDVRSHTMEYYIISGLSERDFIGADINTYVFPRSKLVMVSPELDFSLWNDWSIKEIAFFNGEGLLETVTDINTISDFKEFIKSKDIGKVYESGDSDKAVVKKDSVRIIVYFNEAESVYWESYIYTVHYDGGNVHVSIEIQEFDDYPHTKDIYVEIPSGNHFYESVVSAVH